MILSIQRGLNCPTLLTLLHSRKPRTHHIHKKETSISQDTMESKWATCHTAYWKKTKPPQHIALKGRNLYWALSTYRCKDQGSNTDMETSNTCSIPVHVLWNTELHKSVHVLSPPPTHHMCKLIGQFKGKKKFRLYQKTDRIRVFTISLVKINRYAIQNFITEHPKSVTYTYACHFITCTHSLFYSLNQYLFSLR